MKRPKKKKYKICQGHITGLVENPLEIIYQQKCAGYNLACDDWEAYYNYILKQLPNEEEISGEIKDIYNDWLSSNSSDYSELFNKIAKTISKKLKEIYIK